MRAKDVGVCGLRLFLSLPLSLSPLSSSLVICIVLLGEPDRQFPQETPQGEGSFDFFSLVTKTGQTALF